MNSLAFQEVAVRYSNTQAKTVYLDKALQGGGGGKFDGNHQFSVAGSLDSNQGLQVIYQSAVALKSDLEIEVKLLFQGAPESIQWPMYEGVWESRPFDQADASLFPSAGIQAEDEKERLALPFFILKSASQQWAIAGDPEYHTHFELRREGAQTSIVFRYLYRAAAGVHRHEARRFWVQAVKSPLEGLERFLKREKPFANQKPSWASEIKINYYDYFSKNGQGWYADLEKMASWVLPEDRSKVLVCLHGWYDSVGRYCFDGEKLDEKWTVFPFIQHPQLLANKTKDLPRRLDFGQVGPCGWSNLENYQPTELDWKGIQDRLEFAKKLGFRTAFYVFTGMQGAGEQAAAVEAGVGLEMEKGAWQGPDLVGPTYIQNPLHDSVRNYFLKLMKALIEKVGPWTDAYVMDEAYYVSRGILGPKSCPGYADRAQMKLIQEFTALCHQANPESVFVTADLLGNRIIGDRNFPYSLFADGIFQDAWCIPTSWGGALFPTWGGIHWACNWWPYRNWDWTEYGMNQYDSPLALSNGCFGDDVGPGDKNFPLEFEQLIKNAWKKKKSSRLIKEIPVREFEA